MNKVKSEFCFENTNEKLKLDFFWLSCVLRSFDFVPCCYFIVLITKSRKILVFVYLSRGLHNIILFE